ncbi:MAG: hypothetical protein RBR63_07530 [Methanosarcina vacuolata]|nr:hypothetical protein [Methanosarcina vacuolata]
MFPEKGVNSSGYLLKYFLDDISIAARKIGKSPKGNQLEEESRE